MEKSYCIHNFDNDAFENRRNKDKVWNDFFILQNSSAPWQFISHFRKVANEGCVFPLAINEEDGVLFIRGIKAEILDFMELIEDEIDGFKCGELEDIKDQIDFHCTCVPEKEDGRGGNKRIKFTLPSVTNSYVKILESIMDNGEITVALPKQFIEKFDQVYEDIKGVSPDYDSESYCLYKGGENVFSYKTSVKFDIPDGMTINDIAKIFRKQNDQIRILNEKRIEVYFTDWVIKHLFPIGFDLGKDHDVDAINKWISKNSLNV